jgi:putative transposase
MGYHVLNRAHGRQSLFRDEEDYVAFERVLVEAGARVRMRVLASCVLPNHWPLVLWPRADGALSHCVGWLTLTHPQRWHASQPTVGTGHLYQGRFKSFPVQTDGHVLTVWRYVERHPVRAGLVPQAEHWRWGSLGQREQQSTLAQEL